MTVAGPQTVADKLAEILADVEGLRAVAHPVDQVNTPMAVVSLVSVDYHKAMGGASMSATYEYRVSLVLGRTNERGGWEMVQEYLSPVGAKSVPAALVADRTLAGLVSSMAVGQSIDIGTTMQQDTPYIVGNLEVTVHA